MLVAALTNVVAINLAYDVAVKVSAVNLLLMAVFVAARDTRRLAAAFVQGRAIGRPPMLPPLLAGRRARFAIAAVELLLPLWLLVSPLPRVAANIGGLHFSRAAMPAFGGVFDIATSAGRAAGLKESDGALATWKRVVLTRRSATVLTRNDSIVRYTLAADTTLQRLSLKRSDSDSATMTFRYEIPDSIHVLLRRVDAEATQEVRLRRAEVTLLRWTQRWGW